MKLFEREEGESGDFDRMTADMAGFILQLLARIGKQGRPEIVHTALLLFHSQVRIATYHRFERHIYACGAILVALKLTDNLTLYPVQLIKAYRAHLREQKHGKSVEEDDEEKLKKLVKKLFDAELNIMINIGFDFDIELGADWLQEWAQDIRDSHIIQKTEEALTSLYQTSTVIYFPPQLLCLAALSIVARNEEISIEFSNWSPPLIALFRQHAEQVKQVREFYLSKRSFMYD